MGGGARSGACRGVRKLAAAYPVAARRTLAPRVSDARPFGVVRQRPISLGGLEVSCSRAYAGFRIRSPQAMVAVRVTGWVD